MLQKSLFEYPTFHGFVNKCFHKKHLYSLKVVGSVPEPASSGIYTDFAVNYHGRIY